MFNVGKSSPPPVVVDTDADPTQTSYLHFFYISFQNLGHSVRAKCHHCHDIFIQPLHLSGQIAALFTKDGSGEPFHVL